MELTTQLEIDVQHVTFDFRPGYNNQLTATVIWKHAALNLQQQAAITGPGSLERAD